MRPVDRQALIRQNFEAYRDLTWAETLEPKFREYGVSDAEMKTFREEWNQHTEDRDWPWWQAECASYSDERLDDMRMDTIEVSDALGALKWQREQRPLDPDVGRDYQQTLSDASSRQPTKDNAKEIER